MNACLTQVAAFPDQDLFRLLWLPFESLIASVIIRLSFALRRHCCHLPIFVSKSVVVIITRGPSSIDILKLRRTLAYASFRSQGSSWHRYTVIFRAVNIAYPDRIIKTYWLFPTESEQLSIYDIYTSKIYTYNMYVNIFTTYKTHASHTLIYLTSICICVLQWCA